MKTYFEEPLQVAAVAGSPDLCRLSIRSSENRVDEYVLSTLVIESVISNATSTVWKPSGNGVSVRLVDGSKVYLRIEHSPGVRSSLYLLPLSSVQLLSGQYLDAIRKG